MGFPQRKASFCGALSPRKRLSYSLRPAFEDATDGKEKNHASAVCRVSRSLVHLSSTVLDPHCYLRPICCPFFLRLSHDEAWWYKLCSVAVFEMYGLFLWLLLCIYRAPAIDVVPNPLRCKNEDNGRSLVVAPALCTQLLSANQYVQNNKTESLQNSTSVKQQNSVSTQQRNSKTVTSVSQYFSQSVLQSVSTSVSQCFSQYFSQYFSQSVLNSVSTDVNQSVGLFE